MIHLCDVVIRKYNATASTDYAHARGGRLCRIHTTPLPLTLLLLLLLLLLIVMPLLLQQLLILLLTTAIDSCY